MGKKNVSNFLGVSIVVIFLLYTFTIVKSIPCGRDILSTFCRNFVHTEPTHLLTNIFALFAISKVEEQLGSKHFFRLILFILTFDTIIESTLAVFFQFKCSIGISGLLFGLTSYEMLMKNGNPKIDSYLVIAIILLLSVKSFDKRTSFVGHLVGSLSGIVAGFAWRKIEPSKN